MNTQIVADRELAASSLATMWKIRRFEEAVEDLYGRGLMHGTMHLSIGQEAVPTGACLALNKDDYITSTHRGHGHCIAKGADMERMMAELLAKETGYCRGRGGSMHIADTATGNLGANGIVAGGVPIATGAALSAKMRGTKQVAVSFHGDGAMGEGAWHEGVVLAAMWQLPVVFLCENNLYGMSMSSEKAFNLEQLSALVPAADPLSSKRRRTAGADTRSQTRTCTARATRSTNGAARTRFRCSKLKLLPPVASRRRTSMPFATTCAPSCAAQFSVPTPRRTPPLTTFFPPSTQGNDYDY